MSLLATAPETDLDRLERVIAGSHEFGSNVSLSSAEEARRDALVQRFGEALLGTMDLFTIYLGDRLGFYRALAGHGTLTSSELAAHAGTHERYTREWLEQQAVAGLIAGANPAASAHERRYSLPLGHQEVLLDRDSLNYQAPFARLVASVSGPLPAILQAFRTGDGVPWSAYGADAREGQAEGYRPVYLNLLGKEWLRSIPGLHRRLLSSPPARVADFGCGAGWGSIAIAHAYPDVLVDGFDLDEPSILLAQANAAREGLDNRVSFTVRDAAKPAFQGQYDLVVVLEALHDMSRPVEALRTVRGLLAPGGSVLVVDEKVAEQFTAPGDEVERLMYGFSVLCCLPAGMADTVSAGTGTVMRPTTLRRYAREGRIRTRRHPPHRARLLPSVPADGRAGVASQGS